MLLDCASSSVVRALSHAFDAWLHAQPNASRVELTNVTGTTWNIKPSVLLELLDSHPDVVWLDSDIIVAGDIERSPQRPAAGCSRCRRGNLLGSAPRRRFQDLVRGGWSRHAHLRLHHQQRRASCHARSSARCWRRGSRCSPIPAYLQAQAGPWYERPLHMVGDQEALTGLLGSAEFAHLPIRFLQRGSVIAQCFGPAGLHAVGAGAGPLCTGGPALIHAMGPKPWLPRIADKHAAGSRDMLTLLRELVRKISLLTSRPIA